jgi:hypothetical protein
MPETDAPTLFTPDLDAISDAARNVARSTPGFARSGQPTSAWDTAVRIAGRTGTQRRLCLDYFVRVGERGATNIELEEALGLRRPSGSNRRLELEQAGLVHARTGLSRPTGTGAPAQVYAVTGLGLAVWNHLNDIPTGES